MSLSLQASWHDQSLYLWARPEPGHPPADAAALRAAVGEISSDALLASAVGEGTIGVLLPSLDAAGRADAAGGDRQSVATLPATELERFDLPALILGPAEAVDFLTSLSRDLPPVCGPTVGYWAALARFVCRLIAARQFMPRLDPGPGAALAACWRVLVSDRAQLEWLERFATAMPAACRSTAGQGG